MRFWIPGLSILLTIASSAPGATAEATDENGEVNRARAAEFHLVATLANVDPAIRAYLTDRIPEIMADVGEPFRATDVITDDRPSRRFVVAGHAPDSPAWWVICYEHGGIGYHYHIALMMLSNGDPVVVKAGQWLPEYKKREQSITLDRVLAAIWNHEVKYDNHW